MVRTSDVVLDKVDINLTEMLVMQVMLTKPVSEITN
jgi:hypothetical protein